MVQGNPSFSYCGSTGGVITAFLTNQYPEILNYLWGRNLIRSLNFNDGQLADLVEL